MSDALYDSGRPERNGAIFGLRLPQALVTIVVLVPPVVLFGSGAFRAALILLPVSLVIVALAVVPVRGRPLGRWAFDAACHTVGVLTGWSSFQSSIAAGLPLDPEEPDLPGALSRLEMLDGPWMPGHGRVCVLHDTAEDRWGATARLSARGIGLSSPVECEALADGLGRMLRGLVDSDRIDRVSLLVRAAPDDGQAYARYRRRHEDQEAPELARTVTDDLARMSGALGVRQETFLTVSAREEALRRPATNAGGGADGRAYALYRGLAALAEPLRAMGADAPVWLTSARLGEAVRAGFNPGAAASLANRRLETGDAGLPLAAVGPSRAPSPAARSYAHDAWTTVSWAVVPPREGVRFGSLAPLLAVRTADERRSLAIHYEVLTGRAAARIAGRERRTSLLVSDLRARRGFGTSPGDARDQGAAHGREDSVARGEGMVRYALVVSVTVPADADVDEATEAMEAGVAGSFTLQRLELAQDSGFVASSLPLGIALDRIRSIG